MNKGVVIYENTDYDGKMKVLGVGEYNINELGIPNDTLSSLKVDPGFQITLYEHENFKGKTAIYTKDSPDVGKFNDKTSSIIVEMAPICIIFEKENYQGNRQNLKDGRYNMKDLILGNDKLSSLMIAEGYTVTLYSDKDFQGEKRTYNENQEFVGTFNDKTSSIEVSKKR